MIQREFDSTTKADIDGLVSDSVQEGRTIEYKEKLPGGTDEDTREFLADISSFANSAGGDLIYGVREKRDAAGKPLGIPESADGLGNVNVDVELNRLESKIRDGIAPRIPGVRARRIDGFSQGPVILWRVPKSWAGPHMVTFKNSSRFFSRTSAGKYQLDVHEIRASFLASESITDKIRAFRADRLSKILTGETPIQLDSGPKLVLHLLPISAFSGSPIVDLKTAAAPMHRLKPMGQPTQFGPPQYNFDGLSSAGGNGVSTFSYIQLFRNGAIESVSARIAGGKLVLGNRFEADLMLANAYVNFQKEIGADMPLFLAISILTAKGFSFYPREPSGFDSWVHISPIQQDLLPVPEVMIEDDNTDIGMLMRPAIDALWQSSGWPGSQGYDQNGKWVGYLHWNR